MQGTTVQWVWLEHSYLSCAGISFLYHLHQYNLLLFPHKWRAYKKLIKAEIYVWVENCCSSFELVQKVKYYSIFLKFGKFLLLLFFLFSHHCLCIMMLDFRFHFLTFNKKLCNVFSLSNVCNRIFVRKHVQHVVDIDYTTLVNSYLYESECHCYGE